MTKKKSPKRPALMAQGELEEGQREVLVNKRTGKVASSDNWLIALAARAVKNQDHTGIAALLPQTKAQKLLQKNELISKKQRGLNGKLSAELSREQAKKMLLTLAVLYDQKTPNKSLHLKYLFCDWIVLTLKDSNSEATKIAEFNGYDELLKAELSARWWRDQLNKRQS